LKDGMQTIEQALRDLVNAGRVSMEEAIRRAPDKEALQKSFEDSGGNSFASRAVESALSFNRPVRV
jgi:Tfp pilus assembly ATPase PilU